MLNTGLITIEDLLQALKSLSKAPTAIKWNTLTKEMVAKAQNRVLAEIQDGNFSNIGNLPATPEARLLQTLLSKDLISGYDLIEASRGEDVFIPYVINILKEKIIRPVFDRVFSATFQGTVNEEVKNSIFEGVFAVIHNIILKNPNLIERVGGDIIYNPYPMNRAIEPQTLEEAILLRLLQLPFSFTDKHSLSQLSAIWPFAMFTTRIVKGMIDQGKTKEKIMQFVSEFAERFNRILFYEIGKHQKISAKREPHERTNDALIDVLSDLDFYDLFDKLEKLSGDDRTQYDSYKNELLQSGLTGKRLKEITLKLAEQYCSEAFKEDVKARYNVTKEAKLNKIFKITLLYIMAPIFITGIAFVTFSLLPLLGKIFILSSMAIALTAFIIRLKMAKFGILALYKSRLFKPLTKLSTFWGMNNGRKIGFYSMALVMIAAGTLLIWNSYLAWGALLVFSALSISAVLLGKASNWKEKFFWTSIFMGANSYVFGLMVHHLFWKLAVIDFFSLGFIFTLSLLLLTYIPTLISVYHFAVTLRSYTALNREVWSTTARSIWGLSSLFRFKQANWERMFRKWYKEFKVKEEKYMPLTASGESVGQYLERLIDLLHKRMLLSDAEKDLWLSALKGEGGRFIKPASPKAFEILYNTFFALSQRKPAPDVYSLLTSTSTHVQAAGEEYTYTPENSFCLGTFDHHPRWRIFIEALKASIGQSDDEGLRKKKHDDISNIGNTLRKGNIEDVLGNCRNLNDEEKQFIREAHEEFTKKYNLEKLQTSLLGYMARTHKPEWNNLMARVEEIGIDSKNFIEELRNIDEWIDVYDLIFNKYKNVLTTEQRDAVVALAIDWLNELRPSNKAVLGSMMQDVIEYHLYIAHELGDSQYHKAVREMSMRYSSLKEAYEALALKSKETMLSDSEDTFVSKYERYQNLTDIKLRHILHNVFMWGNKGNPEYNYDRGNNSFTIKKFAAWENLIKGGLKGEFGAEPGSDLEYLLNYNKKNEEKPIKHWAKKFLEWRERNIDEIIAFLNKNTGLRGDWNRVFQTAILIVETEKANVICPIYCGDRGGNTIEERGDHNINMGVPKNAQIGSNMWLFYSLSVNYDAHVRSYPGQNIWRVNYESLHGRKDRKSVV